MLNAFVDSKKMLKLPILDHDIKNKSQFVVLIRIELPKDYLNLLETVKIKLRHAIFGPTEFQFFYVKRCRPRFCSLIILLYYIYSK